ncbi:transporter substrate-binding domain-containing protein [Kiloniella laminariae]|uniref:Transporter substrate-binding domain-containing protein n=1 Tax=Kiloniella laminariae TaxID=454162 RepID=A0ABT4LDI2_9PROT|nr:transporter substrate-binding domain-containing protein [Kiloniella laminariae]MCZ4279160.1 transporter substrate-binding domain-containing protein [Kiloniella laminariae]
MNKIARKVSILIVAIVVMGWSGIASANCARSYSVAYSDDYIPYQYEETGKGPAGLDIDIIKAVMDELGCDLEIRLVPPKRAQKLLQTGDLDLMPAASVTEERQGYAHFSLPYRDEKVVMFVQVSKWDRYQGYSMADAIDHRLRMVAGIGGWYGEEYGKESQRAIDNGILDLNNSTQTRINQLIVGRVDLVIADLFVGYHHAIKADEADKIMPLPHILNSDPVHFMLSKASVSDKEVEAFNVALKAVIESVDFQTLLEKYRPANTAPIN